MLKAKLMVTDWVAGPDGLPRSSERELTVLTEGQVWTVEMIESCLSEWVVELHNQGMQVVRIVLPMPFVPRVLIPSLEGIVRIPTAA